MGDVPGRSASPPRSESPPLHDNIASSPRQREVGTTAHRATCRYLFATSTCCRNGTSRYSIQTGYDSE